MSQEISDLVVRFSDVGSDKVKGSLIAIDGGLGKISKTAALTGGALAAMTLGIGAGLFRIGDRVDSVSDSLTIATGKGSAAVKVLTNDAIDVSKIIPDSLTDIGNAIGLISTRTGDAGKNLESLTASEVELARITGTDLNANITASTSIFNAWGIAAKDQTSTLDGLFNASQKYGVNVSTLMGQVQQFTPQLKQMNLTVDQGANLIGKIDQAGGNVSVVMRGMSKEASTLAKTTGDVTGGMIDVYNSIANAGSAAEANTIAVKAFGSKAGPELAADIRNGTVSVDDFTGAVDSSGKSILATAKSTYDFSENWKLFKNNIQASLVPFGSFVFQATDKMVPALIAGEHWFGKITDNVGVFSKALRNSFNTGQEVDTIFNRLPKSLQFLGTGFLTISDSIGDMVRSFHSGGLSKLLSDLPGEVEQLVGGAIHIPVTLAVDIAGWTLGHIVTPLADWLDAQVGGDGAVTNPELKGLPVGGATHHVGLGQLAVDIGGWIVGSLPNDVVTIAESVWLWLEGKIGVKGQVGQNAGFSGAAIKPVSLGDVTVNVGKWLLHAGESIADAVMRFGVGVGRLGKQAAVPLGDVAVNVGKWLVSAGDSVWDAVGRFANGLGKLGKQVGADIAEAAVNIAKWVKGTIGPISSADLSSWAQSAIDAVKDATADLVNWKLTIKTPSADNISISLSDIASAIWDKLTDPTLLTLPAGSDVKAQNLGNSLGLKLSGWIGKGLTSFFLPGSDKGDQGGGVAWDTVAESFMVGVTESLLFSLGKWENDQLIKVDLWATGFMSSIKTKIHGAIFGPEATSGIGAGAHVEQQSGGLAGAFTGMLDFVEQPTIPAWMSDWSWLTNAISTGINGVLTWFEGQSLDWLKKLFAGDFVGAFNDIFKSSGGDAAGSQPANGLGNLFMTGGNTASGPQFTNDIFGSTYTNRPPFSQAPFGGQLRTDGLGGSNSGGPSIYTGTTQDGALVTTLPGVGTGSALPPHTNPAPLIVPPPDMKAVDQAFATATKALGAFGKQTATAHLSAESSKFDAADFVATIKGEKWVSTTFTAKLSGESSEVDGALFVAFNKASAWDGHEFTARFTIDTSGLDSAKSAAMDAVSFIDSIMPHSPAKKGPLSRLPNWNALFDGIGGAGDRAVGAVSGHASRIAGALGSGGYGRAATGGGGGHTVVYDLRGAHIFDDPDKWINDKVDKRAKKIVSDAISSQRRQESR